MNFIKKILSFISVCTVVITSFATVAASEEPIVIINDVDNPKTVEDFKSEITAFDLEDGDITKSITVVTDNYTGNERVLGEFIVVYGVSDSLGLQSTLAVIIQNVDVTAPEIILQVESTLKVPQFSYLGSNLPDIVAIDSFEGDLTSKMTIVGLSNVNTDVIGDYNVTYIVEDSSGNKATKQFTLRVIDSTDPELNGPTRIIKRADVILDGEFFIDYYTAVDDTDGFITNRITTDNNTYLGNANVPGTYNVTIVVHDQEGNETRKTIIIEVVKDMIPQLIIDDYYWVVPDNHQLSDKEFVEILQFIGDLPDYQFIFSTTYDNYTSSYRTVDKYQKNFSLLSESGEEFDRDITLEVIKADKNIVDAPPNFYEKNSGIIWGVVGTLVVIGFVIIGITQSKK